MPLASPSILAIHRSQVAAQDVSHVDGPNPMSLGDPDYWRDLYARCPTLKDKENLFVSCGFDIVYQQNESLRSRSTAGTILQRCLNKIELFRSGMNRSLCVYKIGLSSNPVLRFHFYSRGNYTRMSLLHVTNELGVAQMLEAALLALHISEKECRNERFGGDGPNSSHHPGPHFVYIVGARADGRKPIA